MPSTPSDPTGAAAFAVAQFAPTADPLANLAMMRDLGTLAQARGADAVVFPEYSAYFEPQLSAASVAASEPLDGPFVAGVATLAKDLGVHVVAGMLERSGERTRVFNTLVAVDPTGRLVATYRKLHLYDAFGSAESDFIVPGPVTPPNTFAVGGLTVGLQTCYDVRFPEVTRRIVDAGADVVLLPAEWVRGPLKEQHWRTLVTARAIENTVYLVAAGQAPPTGIGNSMIVDPMGVEIVTIGEQTDVAVAHLTRARIDAVRAVNPALVLRRFGVVER